MPLAIIVRTREHMETKSSGCVLLGIQREQIPIDISTILQATVECACFARTYEIFTKINCILDHKNASINLKGFKSQKVCSPSPSRIELEINNTKFSGKSTGISKLYKILINNPGTKEEKEKG